MRTTYHAQSALRSSAAIVRRLHDLGNRIADRAQELASWLFRSTA